MRDMRFPLFVSMIGASEANQRGISNRSYLSREEGGGAPGALGLVEPNYPFNLPLYFQTSEEKFAPLLFFREKFPFPLS